MNNPAARLQGITSLIKRRKQMKKSIWFFALVVALLMGLGIDAEAMCGKGHGAKGMGMAMESGMCGKCMGMAGEGPMMGGGMMVMSKKLGLDEKQTAEFKAIHLKMKKERIQKKAEIKIADLELKELLDADPVDMNSVEAKVRKIESLRSELKMSHIKTHETVKAMLTPEQKEKLGSFMGMRMGGGMGMMGDGGCRMMGDRGRMGRMNCCMQQMDDAMPGTEDKDDSDTPDEGHAN
jgi:Spy/CpxP family protein refolding chaperone